jgi:hypothetical protein
MCRGRADCTSGIPGGVAALLDKTRRESADLTVPEGVHREVEGMVKQEIMYSCPHCDSILGFGFFFGGLLTNRP